jgi:hypothetical protein
MPSNLLIAVFGCCPFLQAHCFEDGILAELFFNAQQSILESAFFGKLDIFGRLAVLTALSDNAGISCSDILQIFESDFWTEISAGEYNRLVQLLIERAVVWQDHIDIEIKTEGIKSLIGEFCNAGC